MVEAVRPDVTNSQFGMIHGVSNPQCSVERGRFPLALANMIAFKELGMTDIEVPIVLMRPSPHRKLLFDVAVQALGRYFNLRNLMGCGEQFRIYFRGSDPETKANSSAIDDGGIIEGTASAVWR